ncbi:MAG: hypothetical protein ACRD5M_11940 [Candidatus Acidiferrales bacterium]
MFCPVCKSEYREGFTRCSDCGVDLVPSIPAPAPPNDLALAWRGGDPSLFSAALAALQDAGIAHYEIADHIQLVFELAIPRPRYEILVREADLPKALDLLAPFEERAAWAHARDIWKGTSPFEDAEPQKPQAKLRDEPSGTDHAPDDIAAGFDPKQARTGIWAGEDANMAQNLKDCLREVGIGCVVVDLQGRWSVRVMPQYEARAKEIVREIVEASPPE